MHRPWRTTSTSRGITAPIVDADGEIDHEATLKLEPSGAAVAELVPVDQTLDVPFSVCGKKFPVICDLRTHNETGNEAVSVTVGDLYIENQSPHHDHGDTDEVYFMRGVGEGSWMIIDGTLYELKEGMIVLLPAGVPHGGFGDLRATMYFSPGLATKRDMWARDEAVGENAKDLAVDMPIEQIDPEIVTLTPNGGVISQIPPEFFGDPEESVNSQPFSVNIPRVSTTVKSVSQDGDGIILSSAGSKTIVQVLSGEGWVQIDNGAQPLEKDTVVAIPENSHFLVTAKPGDTHMNVMITELYDSEQAAAAQRIGDISTEVKPAAEATLES